MRKERLQELAGILLTEQGEQDGHGTEMSDREFRKLKSEIRETMEKLKKLQQRYRTQVGRDFLPFI